MSDSDDDDGLGEEADKALQGNRRRGSSVFSEASANETVHLHKLERFNFDSTRDFGIHSKHMQHAQHLMDYANMEEDHTLLEGTHQEIARKQNAEKKARKEQEMSKSIMTEEQAIKRRFSLAMKRGPIPTLERKNSMRSTSMKGGLKRVTSMGSMTGTTGKISPKKEPLKEKWSQLRVGEFGPNYTLDEVKHFYTCFSRVDKDMTGDIDVDEWQLFLTGMDQEMSATDSRRLFMHIDANHNGVISMDEICKVVFNRATPEQLKTMVNVMEKTTGQKRHISKKREDFSRNDLRHLFILYDEQDEKILSVKQLSSAFMVLGIDAKTIEKAFADSGIDVEDGTMDCEEFVDVFSAYLKSAGVMS